MCSMFSATPVARCLSASAKDSYHKLSSLSSLPPRFAAPGRRYRTYIVTSALSTPTACTHARGGVVPGRKNHPQKPVLATENICGGYSTLSKRRGLDDAVSYSNRAPALHGREGTAKLRRNVTFSTKEGGGNWALYDAEEI